MDSLPLIAKILVILGIHALGGIGLARRCLPFRRTPADLLAAGLLAGISIYCGVPVLLGEITGRMHWAWVAISSVISLGLAIWGCWFGGPPRLPRVLCHGMGRRFGTGLLASFALGGCLIGACATSVLPARMSDAVQYHIVNPMVWWNTGRFDLGAFGPPEAHPGEIQATTFPNAKAITPWLALLLQKDGTGTALAQWPFLMVMLAAWVALARRCGLSSLAAWAGWLLLHGIPEIVLQSFEAYADLVLLSAQVAVAWSVLFLIQRPTSVVIRDPWRHGWPLALSLAWVIAAKPTGLLVAPAMAIIAGLAIARCGTIRAVLLPTLTIGVLASLVLAGPWYGRALILYGNPIFPIRVQLDGLFELPGYFDPGVNQALVLQHTGRSGWAAVWATWMEQPRDLVLGGWAAGLGSTTAILAPATLVLALLASRIPRYARRLRWAWLAAALLCIGPLIVPSAAVPRFLLALCPAWILFLGLFWREFHRPIRWGLLQFIIALSLYDGTRAHLSTLGQPVSPFVISTYFGPGGAGMLREGRWPGTLTVETVLREDLLHGTSATVVAVGRAGRPWTMQPAQPRGRWFLRIPDRPDTVDPRTWYRQLTATNSTYALVKISSRADQDLLQILGLDARIFQNHPPSATHRFDLWGHEPLVLYRLPPHGPSDLPIPSPGTQP